MRTFERIYRILGIITMVVGGIMIVGNLFYYDEILWAYYMLWVIPFAMVGVITGFLTDVTWEE